MHISDNDMEVDLPDRDPRAVRIRALLFEQPSGRDPLGALWHACNASHRAVLTVLAEQGETTQVELEEALGINGTTLRGRHGGLAKIAKRLGVEYPIRSVGTRREVRRFFLDPDAARQVFKLRSKTNTPTRRSER